MSWIFVAVSAYFLGAFAVLMDKFLLGSKRISSPQVYTFYVGIFGLGAFLFAPFGFDVPSGWQIVVALVGGAVYVGGIFALNLSINKAEASRVTPVVFSVVPIASYLISYFWGHENLSLAQLGGVSLLILGGLLISFDLPLKIKPQTLRLMRKIKLSFVENVVFVADDGGKSSNKFFDGFYAACASGILLAVSYVIFKVVYAEQEFFSGFIWTRLGGFLAALSLLIVPGWRKAIFKSFSHAKKPSRKHVNTGGMFVVNKILGGTSSILLNKAFQMGSVTLVNSMVSLQYVFVLILVAIAAKRHPKAFAEKLSFWDWAQKIAAIFIIAIGMILISK